MVFDSQALYSWHVVMSALGAALVWLCGRKTPGGTAGTGPLATATLAIDLPFLLVISRPHAPRGWFRGTDSMEVADVVTRFWIVVLSGALLCAAAPQAAYAQTPGRPNQTTEALLTQSREQRQASPTRALPLAEQALASARAGGSTEWEVRALIERGECYVGVARLESATGDYRLAVERSRTVGNPRLTSEALFRLAKSNVSMNRYEEAVRGYLEAVALAEQAGDAEFAAVVKSHLGIAHFVLRNRQKALELCRQAEPVLQRASDQGLYADVLQHIGIIYTGEKNWAEALAHFQRVLAIRERSGSKATLIGVLGNVALALHGLTRDREALPHLDRALALAAGSEDPRIEPFLRLRRAQVLESLGRLADASVDYDRALLVDRTLGNKRRLASTLEHVAGFDARIAGREKHAIAALNEALALNRDIYNQDTSSRINELQERYDTERRQREIELLQRDKAISELEAKRAGLVRIAILIGASMLVVGLVFAVTRYRAEARTARQLLDALQNVRTLQGLLPICAHCKKIRNDDGYWQQVESYVGQHSDATFSHGICPDCLHAHYSDYDGPVA